MKIKKEISKQAKHELKLLRDEMKKTNPDIDLIFELISGSKYTIKIGRK